MKQMPTTSDAKRDHWKQSWNYGMTPEDLAEYCTKKGHRWVKRENIRHQTQKAELAPNEILCGWCGKENDFVDDIGAFWCTPTDKDSRPTCRACFAGWVGQTHQARYGVGER